jgi:HAD superfamily hydrolase (TIGR01509 family)
MLILDFDGVVVDTEPVNYEAWQTMFDREMGLRHEGTHHVLVGLTLDEIFRLWLPELPDRDTMERLLTLKNEHYFALAAERLTPMPGIVDLLNRAIDAGWYTAIASRSRRVRLLRTLELLRLPAIFDAVLGYEDGVNHKTERKEHARAARMFGIDPAHCLVIEDSTQGIRDALDCGIGMVIGITSSLAPELLEAAGAHRVVSSLDDVALS